MSKYSALPDLDTQPDVYETPDTNESGNAAASNFSHDTYSDASGDDEDVEGVVRSSLSASAASQRFAAATQSVGNAGPGRSGQEQSQQQPDFSGSIGRRRRHGYRRKVLPDQDEYSMIGTNGRTVAEKETTLQRLRRLMFEVEELGKDVEAEQKDKENLPVVAGGEDGTSATTAKRPRRKPPTHAQLLAQVAVLQKDLTGMGRTLLGPEEVDAPDAPGRGTQVKQIETGRALLAQLKAFKNMKVSDSQPRFGETAPNPAATSSAQDAAGSASSPYVTYELFYTPETAKLTELAKITQVEARLASLERLIGTHFLQGLEGGNASVTALLQENGSLIGALQRLDNHLSLLTQPRQLDVVAKRVRSLTADMERLADLRKKQQIENSITVSMENLSRGSTSVMQDVEMHRTQTETERRVNHLYSLMEKLDPVAGLVPHLVSRLMGLRSLHTEAAVFAESLTMLVQEQSRVSEGFKGIDETVEHLENSFKANELAVEQNVAALQGRMEALAGRVDTLMTKLK
ncbi:hypothetical protein HKX48_001628 [Thoreauomyces humboldtii]|nr:hypothetical protein HKX48_001628 [Thoreauomyces humboldtii]